MTLRVAAALAMTLGIAMSFGYFYWIGESPVSSGAERHLREMKERTHAPASVTPYTFADFVALPHGRPVAEFASIEQRGVSLEAWVMHMQLSSDGDYHLSLGPLPAPPPVDPATRGLTAELTPQWQRGSRSWQWEHLDTALHPYFTAGPDWPPGACRVRISGWLMYDFQYDEPFLKNSRPHLPGPAAHRLTGWEIHPITRIEIWDDARRNYVEYAR